MPSLEAWLSLSQLPGLNPAKRLWLLQQYKDHVEAWNAGPESWANKFGTYKYVPQWKQYWESQPGLKWLDDCQQTNVRIIPWDHPGYPALLKEIAQPPMVLYLQGVIPDDLVPISVVGTRKPDSYGELMVRRCIRKLAVWPVCVISGMARGIDGIVHEMVCDAEGITIGVLGSGHNHIYPREHAHLYHAVKKNGALISEYPPETPPLKMHFPARNRIIAGLARAVLVIQAPVKSGALITARYALESNRDVWALPADAQRQQSRGCLDLIKDGAALIRDEDDLKELVSNWLPSSQLVQSRDRFNESRLTGDESKIYQAINDGCSLFDDLCHRTDFQPMQVNSALVMLQLKGMIEVLPGPIYYTRT